MIILWSILGLFLALIAVLFVRTFLFTPKKQMPSSVEDISFDKEANVKSLVELVRCKTVSYYDSSREDDAEFEKLLKKLPCLYPHVFRVCSYQELTDRALLFCWKGKRSNAPVVMMAHYDVVPVEEESWKKPPFEGIIEDNILWGRGAVDTKPTFNGVLFAANTLIAEGFVPEQDIYFAFSGGEEVSGKGAICIVNWFAEHNIEPTLVIDEGGAVVEDIFPGVSIPCAYVGIAEKGMMNLTLSVESNGGHASAPKPHTPIGILSQACCKIENAPFPLKLTEPTAQMFSTAGRHSTFLYRLIFANLWLFKGILNGLCQKRGGEVNALLRTTVAFTQAEGSIAPNVIPPSASMTANLRLNPADSIESACRYIKKVIKNDSVKITVHHGMEPSPVSPSYGEAWDKVAAAVSDTWQGCVVTPYLMLQCSDSRHYRDLSKFVYRFSAMDLTAEERSAIHGHNERVRLDAVNRATEFYIRLMKRC